MAFTVQDFEDLLRLLDERPEWLEALRQRVLTGELLEVPRLMRETAESQARTQQVLEAFGRRLDQREQQIDELAQLMKQLALRVDEIARQLEQLTRRVDALAQRVEEIAAQLAQLTRRVDALAERVDQLTQRVDALAQRVEEIAEQLAQLTRRVDVLAERVDQLTQRVDALAQRVEEIAAQLAQLTRRVDALAERVDQLTQRVDALAQRVEEIAEQLAQLTRRVDALAERVDQLAQQVEQLTKQMNEMARQFAQYRRDTDQLKGMMLEMRYAQRPYAYFKDLIRRARTLSVDELYDLLEGLNLTEAEVRDVVECDALIFGRDPEDGKPTYLLLEASWTIDLEDVERASRRAALLSRAGLTVLPVVAGYAARPNILEEAARRNVRCVFDGRNRESDEVA
jgi:chromosome segregation ATPase